MSSIAVHIQRLPHYPGPTLPEYQSLDAAAVDVRAALGAPVAIAPREIALLPSGFAIAVPAGFEAQLRPRSGLATKHGITLANSPATIDADYRGEVMIALINQGTSTFVVEPGMRVAQMLVVPVPRIIWQDVAELPPTMRGAGGFGHTGL